MTRYEYLGECCVKSGTHQDYADDERDSEIRSAENEGIDADCAEGETQRHNYPFERLLMCSGADLSLFIKTSQHTGQRGGIDSSSHTFCRISGFSEASSCPTASYEVIFSRISIR